MLSGHAQTVSVWSADIDGTPMRWEAPHPLRVAAEQAGVAAANAEAVLKAARAAAEKKPRSEPLRQEVTEAVAQMKAAAEAQRAAEAAARDAPMTVSEEWYPVLMAIHGDTPFASKLRRSVGSAAFTGCPRCLLLASKSVPLEDGSPSEVGLKATSFGGAACMAQYQKIKEGNDTPVELETLSEFQYGAEDGTFDETAAKLLFIDDDLDDLLADAALATTEGQMLKYEQDIASGLGALGPNASSDARAAGRFS